MTDYIYKPDGKLHTRFSELSKCTINQVQSVVNERLNGNKGFQNEAMLFGEARHETWADEGRLTGKSAKCFSPKLFSATHVEKEFTTEILPQVILHSRPDVVSEQEATLIDYKTMAAESLSEGIQKAQSYKSSKQLLVYAYQVGIHNIKIWSLIYLIEIWNMKRDKILGYTNIETKPTLADIAKVVPWIKERAFILSSALYEAERTQNAGIQQVS